MSKKFAALFVFAGLSCFANFSFAAEIVSGPSNTVTNADCALLGETITVGMSAKVFGAYNCSATTNLVGVAACHQGGSRSALACNSVQNQAQIDAAVAGGTTPPAPVYPAGCAADGTGVSTEVDFRAFFASSAGGAMSDQKLGGPCDEDKLTGLSAFGG